MLDQEQEFMAAARELVEGFCQEVLGLFGQEDPADVAGDTVAEMFRRIHSLKGLTAAFERPAAAGLCHGLEQVLDALRAGRQSLSLEVAKLLLEAADQLQHLVQNPPEEHLPETALQPLLGRLAGAAEPAPPALRVAPEDLGIEKHIAQALTAAEGQRLLQSLAQGRALYQLDSALPLAAMEERGARLRQSLARGRGTAGRCPGLFGRRRTESSCIGCWPAVSWRPCATIWVGIRRRCFGG
jgi:two-component system, chemotaxis family, sensor kinase CheA